MGAGGGKQVRIDGRVDMCVGGGRWVLFSSFVEGHDFYIYQTGIRACGWRRGSRSTTWKSGVIQDFSESVKRQPIGWR